MITKKVNKNSELGGTRDTRISITRQRGHHGAVATAATALRMSRRHAKGRDDSGMEELDEREFPRTSGSVSRSGIRG
ncbi:hypothetical protein [Burkholderia contaminans]|uniref:hypothetical protein n=1 Tax=Burkholderia contaminans TaxID=488447 RepID=UPI0015827658|nr:hypothetical protein [Burkholderia contaminans]